MQDSASNLFGEFEYLYESEDWGEERIGVVFMLTPSGGNWVYTELQHGDEQGGVGNDTFDTLTLDAAGNLWGTGGGYAGCGPAMFHGYIFELARTGDGWQFNTPAYWGSTFTAGGALAMDAQGNLYGTTNNCGSDNLGTVWEFTPTQ
jgi:hypothetical protein